MVSPFSVEIPWIYGMPKSVTGVKVPVASKPVSNHIKEVSRFPNRVYTRAA